MERADQFDIIHNNFDFLPLSYSRLIRTPMVTTIHGFSSPKILPVYRRYNDIASYVSISLADRAPGLNYVANVYHGIDAGKFPFSKDRGDYLLFFGRIHPDKGAGEAIQAARRFGMKILLAGVIQDREYFRREIEPEVDGNKVIYLGSVGPDERGPLLAGAYALLHLINFREPFGLSMVESMACGTPVIARPLGSIPEIVIHGSTGFHVNTIEEAVHALKLVPAIDRRKCRSLVDERFHRDRMVSDYLDVYREVLGLRKTAEGYPVWKNFKSA
jgi:glycosyltransferase involved in cell wall biosynthesis